MFTLPFLSKIWCLGHPFKSMLSRLGCWLLNNVGIPGTDTPPPHHSETSVHNFWLPKNLTTVIPQNPWGLVPGPPTTGTKTCGRSRPLHKMAQNTFPTVIKNTVFDPQLAESTDMKPTCEWTRAAQTHVVQRSAVCQGSSSSDSCWGWAGVCAPSQV